jgi:AraC-like DNA-binding protein
MGEDIQTPSAGKMPTGLRQSPGSVLQLFTLPFEAAFAIHAHLKGYAFPRHFHDEYHITVMLRGAQYSTQNGIRILQAAGEVTTSRPGEIHDGAPVNGAGREFWTLYFPSDSLRALYLAADANDRVGEDWGAKFTVSQRTRSSLSTLFRSISVGESQLCIEGFMIHAVRLLTEEQGGRPMQEPRRVPPEIELARQAIDDDPARNYTLSELATLTRLSPYQVLHGFQRRIGLPPHAYQMQRRINFAKNLIQRGLPLAQAAADSGFADQSHMSRLFRACIGVPPRWLKPPRHSNLSGISDRKSG